MSSHTQVLVASANMANSFASGWLNLSEHELYAVQCEWSGTPTGTLTLECTNDNAQEEGSVTATTIGGSAHAITGVAGTHVYNASQVGYRFVRLVYTAASGSGTLTAKITLKGDCP